MEPGDIVPTIIGDNDMLIKNQDGTSIALNYRSVIASSENYRHRADNYRHRADVYRHRTDVYRLIYRLVYRSHSAPA